MNKNIGYINDELVNITNRLIEAGEFDKAYVYLKKNSGADINGYMGSEMNSGNIDPGKGTSSDGCCCSGEGCGEASCECCCEGCCECCECCDCDCDCG